MTRVRVHIVTTEGPARVQRLSVEAGLADAELSAVCLNGTTTRLPITGAYTYFVRDHVRRLSGFSAYRLDLNRRVDGGSSWMLGAWIAHLLLAEGRLAMSDDPAEIAVFASGEVAFSTDADRRVEVRAVSHISEKVSLLADTAAAETAAGRRVLVVVPHENSGEARAAFARLPPPLRNRIQLHSVAEAEEVHGLLAVKNIGASTVARRGRRRWTRVSALAACVVIVAAVAGFLHWQSTEKEWRALWQEGRYLDLRRSLDEFFLPVMARQFRGTLKASVTPSPLVLSVTALRPADGGSCAGLRFREGGMASVEVPQSGLVYSLDDPRSLCGFSVTARSANGDGHLWVMTRLVSAEGVREALVPTLRLVSDASAAGPTLLSQELPLYRHDNWSWSMIAVWAPAHSKDVTRLLGADDSNEDAATLARLQELGLVVARARIALTR